MFKFIIFSKLLVCSLAARLPFPLGEIDGRIVGGEAADIKSVPYQASIQLNYFGSFHHNCGGSILNENTIISAAHCFYPKNENEIVYVRVGSNRTMSDGQLVPVASITIHPSYINVQNGYDIAILKLSRNLYFNDYVQPIQLDDGSTSVLPGIQGVISGWGTTEFESPAMSRSLQKTVVPIISAEMCKNAYSNIVQISNQMICAGVGERDSCQGDSGGPLVRENRLIGIISWGLECARPDFPGVYTKVAAYRSWIDHYL